MHYLAIDLFCGAGGFTHGWIEAGGEVLLAVDSWDEAVALHAANHPEVRVRKATLGPSGDWPIENLVANIKRLIHQFRSSLIGRGGDYDEPIHLHLHGSPPCQALSNASTTDGDEGMALVLWFLEFKDALNPDSWSMENVRPLGKRLKDLRTASHPRGVPHQNINSAFFGVPQVRWRVFAGEGFDHLMREQGNDKWRSVVEALPHLDRHHLIPQPSMSRRWRFLTVYEPFPTITSQSPSQIRIVSPRLQVRFLTYSECATLQGWPDMTLSGTSHDALLVGNMVCPPIASAILRQIITNKE